MSGHRNTSPKTQRPGGALFKRNRPQGDPNSKVPNYSGNLEISVEVLQDLIKRANNKEPILMDILAYTNQHPQHGVWLKVYGTINKPFTPKTQPRGTNYGTTRPQLDDDIPF